MNIPEINDKVGGAVLTMAINQYVCITVKHTGIFHEKYQLQYKLRNMQ